MALNLIDFSNIQEFENLYGSQVFSNSENGADFFLPLSVILLPWTML